jgi:hypothetical protein
MSSDLKKAVIYVLDARGKKCGEIPVQFFPSEYSIESSNEFATSHTPGGRSQSLQFSERNLDTLSMDLFFDTFERQEDVRKYTNRIGNLLEIDPDLHAPPVLKLIWGNLNFNCVLIKVNKKFTKFNSDGIPVRAILNVTFKEYAGELQSREKPLQSSDKTKTYIIKQGDSLWSIATEKYGDPRLWRSLADRNQIDNPRILENGKEIIIPPCSEDR